MTSDGLFERYYSAAENYSDVNANDIILEIFREEIMTGSICNTFYLQPQQGDVMMDRYVMNVIKQSQLIMRSRMLLGLYVRMRVKQCIAGNPKIDGFFEKAFDDSSRMYDVFDNDEFLEKAFLICSDKALRLLTQVILETGYWMKSGKCKDFLIANLRSHPDILERFKKVCIRISTDKPIFLNLNDVEEAMKEHRMVYHSITLNAIYGIMKYGSFSHMIKLMRAKLCSEALTELFKDTELAYEFIIFMKRYISIRESKSIRLDMISLKNSEHGILSIFSEDLVIRIFVPVLRYAMATESINDVIKHILLCFDYLCLPLTVSIIDNDNLHQDSKILTVFPTFESTSLSKTIAKASEYSQDDFGRIYKQLKSNLWVDSKERESQ